MNSEDKPPTYAEATGKWIYIYFYFVLFSYYLTTVTLSLQWRCFLDMRLALGFKQQS